MLSRRKVGCRRQTSRAGSRIVRRRVNPVSLGDSVSGYRAVEAALDCVRCRLHRQVRSVDLP